MHSHRPRPLSTRSVRSTLLGLLGITLTSIPLHAQFDPKVLIREEQSLSPVAATSTEKFGSSSAMSGDFLIVGATGHDQKAVNAGAAYLFEHLAGSWVFRKKVTGSQTKKSSLFGSSVDIDGDIAVIGAVRDKWAGDYAGAAYIFRRQGNNWLEEAHLTAPDGDAGQRFGGDVSISGDTVVISASGDDEAVPNSGALYVYRHQGGGSWTLEQKLKADTPEQGINFALTAEVSGDWIATTAPGHLEAGDRVGKVIVFRRNGGLWSTFDELLGTDLYDNRYMGARLAMDGDRIATTSVPETSGSAFSIIKLFEFDGSQWAEIHEVTPEFPYSYSSFGTSLAIDGDTLVVGDTNLTTSAGSASGVVHCFQKSGPVWRQRGLLLPTEAHGSSFVGRSVAVSGDRVIGASSTVSFGSFDSGRAWSFHVPEPPLNYCVAKPHTGGCTPRISWRGFPSTTASSEFKITAFEVLNQKSGILFYGFGANNLPFQGGTLCVATPTKRTPPMSSAGNAGPADCTGGFVFDFLPLIQSGADPSLSEGSEVYAQYWFRDPNDPHGTGLTDAVSFQVGP